jgi:hypothetical protein
VDLSKLSTADKVIGASAILFLIAMFLPWWGIDFGEGFGSASNSGWDYFLTGILPLLIALAMVAVIYIQKFTSTELPKPPLPWSQLFLIAGAAIAVLLVLRVIIGADEGAAGITIELDREWGLWVALIAALGLGAGGYLKSQESEDAIAGRGTAPPTPF